MTETVCSDWADAGSKHRTQQAIRTCVVTNARRRSAIASHRSLVPGTGGRLAAGRAKRCRHRPCVADSKARTVRDRARLNAVTGLKIPYASPGADQQAASRRQVNDRTGPEVHRLEVFFNAGARGVRRGAIVARRGGDLPRPFGPRSGMCGAIEGPKASKQITAAGCAAWG